MRARNSRLGIIIISIFAAIFLVMSIIGGIQDLTAHTAPIETAGDGEVIEYNAYYAEEVYEITHRLFGFIPTRHEHFYVIVGEYGANEYIVLASEKWVKDNFPSNGFSDSPVHITALLRRTAPKNGLNTREINNLLSDSDISINEYLYADIGYKTAGVFKITAGVLIIVIAALVITLVRLHALQMLNSKVGTAATSVLIVSILALAVILVWFID